MPEPTPASTAWLLSPEELVAACEALGVLALPHSTWVSDAATHPRHVAAIGRRSLGIARLASTDETGRCIVEPRLAEAILALNEPEPAAVAWFSTPVGATHVTIFAGAGSTTMLEGPDGIELIRAGAAEGLRRLELQLATFWAVAIECTMDGTLRPPGEAVIARSRWDAILGGRPVRQADAPLAAQAAVAAAEAGSWEAACLRFGDGGGYTGTLGGWVLDEDGLMAVEVEPDAAAPGEPPALRVRAVTELETDLAPLWDPARAHVAELAELAATTAT